MSERSVRISIEHLLAETKDGNLNPIFLDVGKTIDPDVGFVQDIQAAITSGQMWWTANEPAVRKAVCENALVNYLGSKDEIKTALELFEKILKVLEKCGVNTTPAALPVLAAQAAVLVLRLGREWCNDKATKSSSQKKKQ